MELYTNIIRNEINLGGSSACSAGTPYCPEGYGLYFPCLTDITRGQAVCMEFYVTDTATQDVADLRDVDAISLDLNGLYGCTYGTFSYPDDISSLQTEDFEPVYENKFGERWMCHLDLVQLDTHEEGSELYMNVKNGNFYSGTRVSVSAYDTPTHIFLGWAMFNDDEEECETETWEDLIVSRDSDYSFVIDKDMTLFALYRPRKSYTILIDEDNRNSHFNVIYKNTRYLISNRPFEVYNDGWGQLENVLEGYHFIAECVPNVSMPVNDGSDSDETGGYTFRFKNWKDGNKSRARMFCAGEDTAAFEKNGEIKLIARCTGPVPIYELEESGITPVIDMFDQEGVHINTQSDIRTAEMEYDGDEFTASAENLSIVFMDDNGYLRFSSSKLILLPMDIEDGVKISLTAWAENECEVTVRVNGMELNQEIANDEFKVYEFYFRNCGNSHIEIICNDECLMDSIQVFREVITDKGKAMLCLDTETTANLPRGPLSVSGAIMVNGESYGLADTPIGTVNKLKKITII